MLIIIIDHPQINFETEIPETLQGLNSIEKIDDSEMPFYIPHYICSKINY